MQKPLIALVFCAAAIGYAAPALAMTDGEYRFRKEQLNQDFSHRFVNCIDYSGSERRKCESDIRKERDSAMQSLKANYKSTREPDPAPATARP
jgi:hypothetical protein